MAAGFTETTLAVGSRGLITDDSALSVLHPRAKATPSPKPSVTATPASTATPVPVASATPVVPAAGTATTNSFVHMRSSNTTTSDILFNLDGGTVVTLLPYSDGSWQQVEYNGTPGYIFKSYLSY
jgi:uncharacterized protein YgiM (DUF1202 family)